MAEPVYTARVRVYQDRRPRRRAYVAPFDQPIVFGVHSEVASFYKISPDEPLPSTLDYLVAAAAG
ncbi:MAG: hypothetical protein QN173_02615 [Armatimonadota bacterium]|nr:hypothetical protein [Armatimonadota bacterium]MDR7402723.1 hypothetical protein [Armatimonadota bacterium]MDR7403502.1 hypothetical protein [Armatimonadota bacterium]MDR7438068.1 hypothetical protein [Armatimonadota bacterium]MDR7473045.1 hypothetical protein [Armatimonadota bacterium]